MSIATTVAILIFGGPIVLLISRCECHPFVVQDVKFENYAGTTSSYTIGSQVAKAMYQANTPR